MGLLSLAANADTLRNGFFLDDFQAILGNPWIRDPSRLGEAFGTHLVGFDPRFTTSYYRPLVHVVYAACHGLSGLEPWGYHLASVLVNALVSSAVYVLVVRWGGLAPQPGERSGGDRPFLLSTPFIAAAFFALHPVHAEAVAWAGAVMDLGYALFFLLALLAGTSQGTSPVLLRVTACLLFLGALLFKEPAVMVIPTMIVAFGARGDLGDPGRRRPALNTVFALSFTFGVYLLARIQALGGVTAGDRRVQLDAPATVFTAAGLLGSYVEKLVWPVGLRPFHDFEPITTAWDARVAVGLVIAFASGALLWRHRRVPGIALGGALFFLPLLPALHAPSVGKGLLSERYLYLPSAGAALWLAAALDWSASRRRQFALRSVLSIAALAAFALMTLRQNAVWRDNLTLWAEAARQSPRSAPILERLGNAQLAAGDAGSAVATLSRALEVDPNLDDARINLATSLANLGYSGEARAQSELVLRRHPNNVDAHLVRAWTFASEGNFSAAVVAYEAALSLDPGRADAHNSAGVAYAQLGQLNAARLHFEAAVRLDPANVHFGRNLARVPEQATKVPREPTR